MNGNVSGGNGNLSSAQFQLPGPPKAHSASDNLSSSTDRSPLGLSGSLGTTASRRVAWRLDGVQPYSKATMGSTFNPNA